MRITLTVTAGPNQGQTFSFTEHATLLVGRSPDVHVHLKDDPYFSRVHFLVEVNPPLCRLQDLGSKNRTRVNGREIEKFVAADLRDGDVIEGGQTVLRVVLDSAAEPEAGTDDAPPGPAPATLSLPNAAQPAVPETLDYLSDMVSRLGGLTGTAFVEALLDDQKERWERGQRVLAEAYFDRLPALRSEPEAAVRLICAEIGLRRSRGETAEAAQYGERFPAYREAIERRLRYEPGTVIEKPKAIAAPFSCPTIPGYRIEQELGRGGMGIVYRAVALADGTTVALKTILPAVRPTAKDLERFLREANVLKQLRHSNIVAFRDLGSVGGLLFFAMEYVPGTDAAKVLKAEGPLPVGRAVRWTVQLLEALAYAHDMGFVHRDVKPSNLLVTTAEGGEVVKLADFGLAKACQASRMSGLTMTGDRGGTPAFMPPEQVLDFRSVKPAADQYSAAATLYNLLTGKPVVAGSSVAEMFQRILTTDPVPLEHLRPDVPVAVASAVGRALARKPEQRFDSVQEFRARLGG